MSKRAEDFRVTIMRARAQWYFERMKEDWRSMSLCLALGGEIPDYIARRYVEDMEEWKRWSLEADVGGLTDDQP